MKCNNKIENIFSDDSINFAYKKKWPMSFTKFRIIEKLYLITN
jgi:hypothetical protein